MFPDWGAMNGCTDFVLTVKGITTVSFLWVQRPDLKNYTEGKRLQVTQ